MNNRIIVFDACALIAFFENEPGCNEVERIILQSAETESLIIMHSVNLLEVYYGFLRDDGQFKANEMIERFNELPIQLDEYLSREIFYEAGRLKAAYKLSLADSIAFAEAIVRNTDFVTADPHEFDVIEKSEKVKII